MSTRLVALFFLLCVTPVSADVIRIARPRYGPPPKTTPLTEGVVRRSGSEPSCARSTGAPIPCTVDFEYFGGAVISNVKVYAIFWSSEVSAEIQAGIGGFYQTLTNSEFLDWLTEYSTDFTVSVGSHVGLPGTQQIIGRGTYAGGYVLPVLSKSYPPCTSGAPLPVCLGDADLQSEIDWQIRHGNLPIPDSDTIFVMHFPSSALIRDPGAVACTDYCAYHSSYASTYQGGVSQTVHYAVLPDQGSNGCQQGCGAGTSFQNTCSSVSHEIVESMTDSEVGAASLVDYPLGWYDNEAMSQGEIADVCNQQTGTVGVDGLTGCASGDAGCYTLQQIFSKAVWDAARAEQPNVQACVASRYDVTDYSIAITPNTLLLAPGATAPAIPILTTLTNGATEALTLTVTDVPTGLHAAIDAPSVNVGGTANLIMSADANAAPFVDGVLVVQATGSVTHSAALLVRLSAVPNDWSLYLTPASQVLFPGTSATYQVQGRVTLGQAETVTLSPTVTGLPPGVTASFNSSTLTPGTSTASLTLTAGPQAASAPTTIFSVSGVNASQTLSHTGMADVEVDTTPTIVFSKPATGATVSGDFLVQVTATPGANAHIVSVTIAVDSDAPLYRGTGLSVSWNTRQASNGSHTLTATVLDDDGASGTTSIEVNVANIDSDFSMSISPQSLNVPVGGSAQFIISTVVTQGVAESITMSFSGLPTGVNASFSPGIVTAGNSATVKLVAPTGTATATSTTVMLLGTSPSQTTGHTVTANVTVGAKSSSGGGCSSSGGGDFSLGPLALGSIAFLSARRRRSAAAADGRSRPPAPF
jgi:Bacterial Ig domain